MPLPTRLSIPSVLLAVALSSPPAIEGQNPNAGSGAASGQVLQTTTDRGIMGAFLLAFDGAGEIVGRGFSGQGGLFTIVLPVGGPYRIEVESMGYRVATVDSLRITPTDTLRLQPILLMPDTAAAPGGSGGERLENGIP